MWRYILPSRVTRSRNFKFYALSQAMNVLTLNKLVNALFINRTCTIKNPNTTKKHYTSATSLRCAIVFNDIEGFIYQRDSAFSRAVLIKIRLK